MYHFILGLRGVSAPAAGLAVPSTVGTASLVPVVTFFSSSCIVLLNSSFRLNSVVH